MCTEKCELSTQPELAKFTQHYLKFLQDSPSAFHAAQRLVQVLTQHGWQVQDEHEVWAGHRFGVVQRAGAVVAWRVPEKITPHTGFRIIGTHTDSPSLKVKPTVDTRNFGFGQVNVEVYGGPLLNSWFNRDLGLAGVVTTLNGDTHLVKTPALMFIPQLAPHLDRASVSELKISAQQDLHPVWTLQDADLLSLLAEYAKVAPTDIAGMDLFAYDVNPPQLLGGGEGTEFLASGRQDNLSSVFAALSALLCSAKDTESEDISVFVAFDHEEVGSQTYTGGDSKFLEAILQRIAAGLGLSDTESFFRLLANSSCISADAGHSINPNQPQKHDPAHQVTLGAGPLLKINAQQRYATDAQGIAMWLRACHYAGVSTQEFVSNNDVSCGSTIGPFTAAGLGICTVDVGVPLLSMHSIREISVPQDVWQLSQALEGYLVGA